ncbi:hypothetical protein AXF42_Ash004109 [Apostasia shenzhenica]|uniref:RBR-type E3 ubiquitin transferase n=1 Tax=Apostasia shenzhenica TaxID=1088818 RepID=A0A2I0A1Z8_9ASPA|nr:hypothetical protein AXF42_Ash004109 [Apostasia shenzhenica]
MFSHLRRLLSLRKWRSRRKSQRNRALKEDEKNSGKCDGIMAEENRRERSRQGPVISEEEVVRDLLAEFRSLTAAESPSPENPSTPNLLAGKPVIEIGESSGTASEEKSAGGIGDSSADVIPEPEFACQICTEQMSFSTLFVVDGCTHIYCKRCISRYVRMKVLLNMLFIKCPDPDCLKGKLEPTACWPILPPMVFDLWSKALCESSIEEKIYCPYEDCSALMIWGKEEVMREAECPHCFRLLCAHCKVPWHAALTCKAHQKLQKNVKRLDLMLKELAMNEKWQRCPKCKFYVEKSGGCMSMHCRYYHHSHLCSAVLLKSF